MVRYVRYLQLVARFMASNNQTNNLFVKGNEFWKQRCSHSVPSIMACPQKLFEACNEYFQWCQDNPLLGEKIGFSKAKACKAETKHVRALTINGLTLFLFIAPSTWYDWRKNREELQPVISWAERVIYNQKFSGAAAGLLKESIIIRELGLQDHTKEEIQHLDQHGNKANAPLTAVDAYKGMLEVGYDDPATS